MARSRRRTPSKTKEPGSGKPPFHAFWSGSLSFGLVNVPVLLFPASRHSGVRLRLMSPSGSLLERRFFCPRDGKEVNSEEIVRGYELDDGTYVIVNDHELEAIEPKKTHEIDLRQFVDLAVLSPTLLERGYYLTPLKHATKAYRLLAEAMERTGRAGIATFVMREREYLVAIFARDGILCAATLRFQDELRDPQSIGLPAPAPVARRLLSAFGRSVDDLFAKRLSRAELADKSTLALRAIIERKKKAGRDLVRADHEANDVDSDREHEVDLVATIRRSLRRANDHRATASKRTSTSRSGAHAKSSQKHTQRRKHVATSPKK
jgi:DNA end-binding protein Ku